MTHFYHFEWAAWWWSEANGSLARTSKMRGHFCEKEHFRFQGEFSTCWLFSQDFPTIPNHFQLYFKGLSFALPK
jgi:hypothetical protein